MPFTIWIDADACPREVKQVVFRASKRLSMPVCLVANAAVPAPRSDLISVVRVEAGLDVADHHIAKSVVPGDLVITADIPLAARAVEAGATAIDPRGDLYTEQNVRTRLSMRDFMQELRTAGLVQGGPPPFSKTDTRRFAATLDRLLTARKGL